MQVQGQELSECFRLVSCQTSWYLQGDTKQPIRIISRYIVSFFMLSIINISQVQSQIQYQCRGVTGLCRALQSYLHLFLLDQWSHFSKVIELHISIQPHLHTTDHICKEENSQCMYSPSVLDRSIFTTVRCEPHMISNTQ